MGVSACNVFRPAYTKAARCNVSGGGKRAPGILPNKRKEDCRQVLMSSMSHLKTRKQSSMEMCQRRTVLSMEAESKNWERDQQMSSTSCLWPLYVRCGCGLSTGQPASAPACDLGVPPSAVGTSECQIAGLVDINEAMHVSHNHPHPALSAPPRAPLGRRV